MSLQIEKLQLLWATTALTYCQRVFGEEGQYDDIALFLSDYLYLPLSCHIMSSILLARSAPVPAWEDDHDPSPCAAASGAQSTQDTVKLNDEINLLHCTQYK